MRHNEGRTIILAGGHFIVGSTVNHTSSLCLVQTAPLFEKERDAILCALILD
jgi:hypothetical protein